MSDSTWLHFQDLYDMELNDRNNDTQTNDLVIRYCVQLNK